MKQVLVRQWLHIIYIMNHLIVMQCDTTFDFDEFDEGALDACLIIKNL